MNFIRRLIYRIDNIFSALLFHLYKIIFALSYKKKDSSSLLLVNLGLIGDIIISSIIFENESKFKKYSKITYLIYDKYIDLFSSYDGNIDIIGVSKAKFKYSLIYKYKFLKKLRNAEYGTSVNLTAGRAISSDTLTLLSGANITYALNLDAKGIVKHFKDYFDSLYTEILYSSSFNEYEKNIYALKQLCKSDDIKFFNERTFQRITIKEFNTELPILVLAPFTSEANRDWSKQNYIELIKKLQKEFYIIILASEEQEKKVTEIFNSVTNENIFRDKTEFKLSELPSVIAQANCFIGADSGMTHLALKMNRPLVGIIGGGNFNRYFPYGESSKFIYLFHELECFNCEWRCYKDEQYCITNINVQKVYDSVKSLVI